MKRTMKHTLTLVLALIFIMSLCTIVPASERVDVIVVGAGTAGLPAAFVASEAGAKVVVIEKMGFTGGSLNVSGASIAGAVTQFSKDLDLGDEPDKHFFESMRMGSYRNVPELLKLYTDNAGGTIDWLADLGVGFKNNRPDFALEHALYEIPRTYTVEEGAASVGKLLTEKLEANGVPVLLDTRAVELIQDASGKVIGLWAVDNTGKFIRFEAEAILLTTGGFAANIDMLKQFKPGLTEAFSVACPSNTGDGIRMARAIGAGSTHMNYFSCYPWAIDRGKGVFITGAGRNARHYGAIHVNSDGERFVDEGEEPAFIGEQVVQQKGSTNYILFDHAMVEAMYEDNQPVLNLWNKLNKFEKEADTGKLAKKGDTIEELATALDIDPETLADTITRYNSFVELGRDEDFGRKELQAKFENGPFYAIQTYVYTMSSMGGLTVNTDFQVLDTNGRVIPGLYAAGMTAGGVHGERMGSGNGIGWGLTSGRLAGSSIVDHL